MATSSQIIYIGIVRDKKAFLCDYTSAKGNFIEMVKTIIQRVRIFHNYRFKELIIENHFNTISMAFKC